MSPNFTKHGDISGASPCRHLQVNQRVWWSGWWFQTWILFSIIYGIILPLDFHIFQRGGSTTNQWWCFWNRENMDKLWETAWHCGNLWLRPGWFLVEALEIQSTPGCWSTSGQDFSGFSSHFRYLPFWMVKGMFFCRKHGYICNISPPEDVSRHFSGSLCESAILGPKPIRKWWLERLL